MLRQWPAQQGGEEGEELDEVLGHLATFWCEKKAKKKKGCNSDSVQLIEKDAFAIFLGV